MYRCIHVCMYRCIHVSMDLCIHPLTRRPAHQSMHPTAPCICSSIGSATTMQLAQTASGASLRTVELTWRISLKERSQHRSTFTTCLSCSMPHVMMTERSVHPFRQIYCSQSSADSFEPIHPSFLPLTQYFLYLCLPPGLPARCEGSLLARILLCLARADALYYVTSPRLLGRWLL